MKEELELQLVKKYPVIFRDYGGDMRETCMAWGITVGPGWYDIIDNLCQTIEEAVGDKKFEVVADQVKEKFGGLRFYYHINYEPNIFEEIMNIYGNFMCRHLWGIMWNKSLHFKRRYLHKSVPEKVRDAVNQAERLSYKTCETCGKPGKREGNGWVRTTCEECKEKDEV